MTPDTCLTDFAVFLLALTGIFIVATLAGVVSDVICSIRGIPDSWEDRDDVL